MKNIYFFLQKQFAFTFLICFFSFYSHAQQLGVGLQYDLPSTLKNIRPFLFRQYKQGKRYNEWYFRSYDKLRETNIDSAWVYDANNKPYKEPYFRKRKYDDFKIGHTRNIRVGSFYNNKLSLWLGIHMDIYLSRALYIPTENIGYLSKFYSASVGFRGQVAAQYQIIPRLTLGLSASPSSLYVFQRGQRYSEILNSPFNIPNDWVPEISLGTQWGLKSISYNVNLRYALKQKEVLPVISPKPSKSYYGFGINGSLNPNKINIHYDFGDWYFPRKFDPYSFWSFGYGINAFRIKNDRKRFEELYLGKFFSRKGKIVYSSYIAKDTIGEFDANRNYFGASLGYSRYNKIKKISNRIVDCYVGTNTELAFLKENAKPLSSNGYNLSRTKFDFRIFASATALWKCSERFYIETRWTPHLSQSFILEYKKGDSPLDPTYGGKTSAFFFTQPFLFDPAFQVGIRYVTKVVKPKKKRKK
jgi:hypothetical protein